VIWPGFRRHSNKCDALAQPVAPPKPAATAAPTLSKADAKPPAEILTEKAPVVPPAAPVAVQVANGKSTRPAGNGSSDAGQGKKVEGHEKQEQRNGNRRAPCPPPRACSRRFWQATPHALVIEMAAGAAMSRIARSQKNGPTSTSIGAHGEVGLSGTGMQSNYFLICKITTGMHADLIVKHLDDRLHVEADYSQLQYPLC
jgi:hypothetical protein